MTKILDHFKGYNDQINAEFQRIRKTVDDSAVKGGQNEIIFRDFLSNHVKNSFICTGSQICDSKGNKTDELDIAVCNESQLYQPNGGLLIAEGVNFVVQGNPYERRIEPRDEKLPFC
ncbi:MAG: hypothetical protein GY760_04855 [Deltaproteobacteria bacterium]|nr:hypothetical protein [Deltaproteobacteria bacterium]